MWFKNIENRLGQTSLPGQKTRSISQKGRNSIPACNPFMVLSWNLLLLRGRPFMFWGEGDWGKFWNYFFPGNRFCIFPWELTSFFFFICFSTSFDTLTIKVVPYHNVLKQVRQVGSKITSPCCHMISICVLEWPKVTLWLLDNYYKST